MHYVVSVNENLAICSNFADDHVVIVAVCNFNKMFIANNFQTKNALIQMMSGSFEHYAWDASEIKQQTLKQLPVNWRPHAKTPSISVQKLVFRVILHNMIQILNLFQ